LGNRVGEAVLAKLVGNEILVLKDNHYHLDPERLSSHIGVSWHDLRSGRVPDSLIVFLQSIQV
jgi:hypothetical protein